MQLEEGFDERQQPPRLCLEEEVHEVPLPFYEEPGTPTGRLVVVGNDETP